ASGSREVVEAQPEDDGTTHPTRGAHPPGNAIDQSEQDGIDLRGRAAPTAERALRPDRAAPPARLYTPRLTAVGERIQLAAGRPAEDGDEDALGDVRHLADGRNPELVQLVGGDDADTPEPFDRQRMQKRQLAVGRH